MLALASLVCSFLPQCFALPQARSTHSSPYSSLNSLPEPVGPTIPVLPGGGLAGLPEIVDETNPTIISHPTQADAIPVDSVSEILGPWESWDMPDALEEMEYILTQAIENNTPWNSVLDQIQTAEPELAQILQNGQTHGLPQALEALETEDVIIPEDDEIPVDYSKIPDLSGLGYAEYPSNPLEFEDSPLMKRNLRSPQPDEPELGKRDVSPNSLRKRDTQTVTLEEWNDWYKLNKDDVFEKLYRAVESVLENGGLLERQAYQESRATSGYVNPVAFLNLSLYPILNMLEGYADYDKEQLIKELLGYNEPEAGLVEVKSDTVQTFGPDFMDNNFLFSAAAKTIASPGSKFTNSVEARAFETWAKGRKGIPKLVADTAAALDNVFASMSNVYDHLGLLAYEIEDVQLEASDSFDVIDPVVAMPKSYPAQIPAVYQTQQLGAGVPQRQQPAGAFDAGNDSGSSFENGDSSYLEGSILEEPEDVYVAPGEEDMFDSSIRAWVNGRAPVGA
ncbi:hypothetical protein H072_10193 [Dactylellina haptotyla CBS 200.50]|uniref:Uncharacterized protein n=1 Tax=Dactylellina haptotyla (strain CBS 200.50) TaxID=1284197 RepID=S7ZZW7_DACHA|nr:hypothetical protein H072_10193 [Dactylellina haptotyla CBS 200.50]